MALMEDQPMWMPVLARYEDLRWSRLQTDETKIILETVYDEVGHVEDHTVIGPEIEDASASFVNTTITQNFVSLPMVIFRVTKTFVITTKKFEQIEAKLVNRNEISFPSKRLLDSFAQVMVKLLDPVDDISVEKPDLISMLTSAITLKCDSLIETCIEKIHLDRLQLTDFSRGIKLAKRFHLQHEALVDSLYLYGIRHCNQLKEDENLANWEDEEIFTSTAKRIQGKFHHLFVPVKLEAIPFQLPNVPTREQQQDQLQVGYPHLIKHRLDRLVLPNKERHYLLVREYDEAIICSAKIVNNDKIMMFDRYPSKKMNANTTDFCCSVEASFLGDVWVVFDSLSLKKRSPYGQIMFSHNALGRIPNSLRVLLTREGTTLYSKQPNWNEYRGYTLDFRGRVKIPSKKNFLLLEDTGEFGSEQVVMSFGKKTKHEFSLDIAHPISPAVAFATALTAFAEKIIVT
jgi:hypothetical protein